MSKRAVILAGGRGTRLRPYTVVFPKPLMPIGEYPIVEVVIRQLVANGFDHITMAVNHQADLIKAYFGDGSKWGIKIDFSLEVTPLGTMGPLRLIKDLPEDFLVMNGDILTDLNYADFYHAHINSKQIFSISSYQRNHLIDYGVLETDEISNLKAFIEKPTKSYQVSMGIYMVNKHVLTFIPESKPYGFDNLMVDLLGAQRTVNVKVFSGYWLDIGRPDDYMQAIEEFEDMRTKFLYD